MTSPTHTDSTPTVEAQILHLEQEIADLRQRLGQLERTSIRFDQVFQPWIGFLAACAFTTALILFCFAVFRGEQLRYYLSYIAPIAFPFVGFLFDRLARYTAPIAWKGRIARMALDGAVLAVSLVRSMYALPFVSGHAFFLTYALLTVKSWWVRLPVVIVLAEVVYFKYFLWHDATLYGGAIAGALAAAAWWALTVRLKRSTSGSS